MSSVPTPTAQLGLSDLLPLPKGVDDDADLSQLFDLLGDAPATTYVPGLDTLSTMQPAQQIVTFGPSFTHQTQAFFANTQQAPSTLHQGLDSALFVGEDPFLPFDLAPEAPVQQWPLQMDQQHFLVPNTSGSATLDVAVDLQQPMHPASHGSGQQQTDAHDSDEEYAPAAKRPARRRGTRTPEERAQATLEKNRRAQKRFREKSKQRKVDMETTMKSLTDELHRLTVENANMVKRTSMMEKVLALRDEQIIQFQQDKQVFNFGPALPQLRAVGAGPVLPASATSAMQMPREQAHHQQRPYEELMREYRKHVAEMSGLLSQHDCTSGATQQELASRLIRLANGAGQLCMLEALNCPLNCKKLLADDGHATVQEADAATMWQPLVAQLDLTAEQQLEVARLRSMFLARAQQLLVERRRLTAELQLATGATLEGNELRSMARDLVNMHTIAQDLNANLREEHMAVMDLGAVLYKKILKPLPLARVLVHSYPAFPDALALTTAVARCAGAVDAGSSTLALLQ